MRRATRGIKGDDRVQPGTLPGGRYATLTYRDHGRRANKLLIEWARDHDLTFDRHDTPEGDAFACRYEGYPTDRKSQPRKTKWAVELAFRLAD